MKRILGFLGRLYPSTWRERYGAEFEALLAEMKPSARDVLDVFWGALSMRMTKWAIGRITIACSVTGMLLAVGVSFGVPARYQSQAIFTATPADESMHRYLGDVQGNAFSREALKSIIQAQNLYPVERARQPLGHVIDHMQRDIRVYPATAASLRNPDALKFVVQFEYSDPRVAQSVNVVLASRLITVNYLTAPHNSDSTLYIREAPSLPLKPAAPNRALFGAVGLFSGLLSGITLATALRWRSSTTAANT